MLKNSLKNRLKNNSINLLTLLTVFTTLSCSHDTEDMVFIKAGEFIMGSDEEDTEGLAKKLGSMKKEFYLDEKPKRFIYINAYYIDKYEVTNKDYQLYVASTGVKSPMHWQGTFYPDGSGDLPVVNVSLTEANKFCKWKGKKLPTEQQWEKASRGPDGLTYPWGMEYDETKANLGTTKVAPVGTYLEDKSYYGVYDMGGNVIEFVNSYYMPYTKNNKNKSKLFGKKYTVARGGLAGIPAHYTLNKLYARGAYRHFISPVDGAEDTGFRCAKTVK